MLRRLLLSRRNVPALALGAGSAAGILAGWLAEDVAYPINAVAAFGTAVLVGGVVAVLLLRAIRAAQD